MSATLKAELVSVKEKWAKECKVKAHGASKDAPWPLTVRVKIPQPSDSRCDILDVTVTLIIKGVVDGEPTLAVEVKADAELPQNLLARLPEVLVEQWRRLRADKCKGSEAMGFVHMFDEIQRRFDSLLSVCPECVDSYLGCDESGASVRRFTLVETPQEDEQDEEEEESEDEYEGLTLEERLAAIELKEAEKRPTVDAAELLKKEAWAKKRREMAEQGLFEDGEVKRVSKKEQEEAWKAKHKQGVRQAKTGANKKKYEGPGSKVEREKGKKKD